MRFFNHIKKPIQQYANGVIEGMGKKTGEMIVVGVVGGVGYTTYRHTSKLEEKPNNVSKEVSNIQVKNTRS